MVVQYFAQLRDRLARDHDRVVLPAEVDAPGILAAIRARHPSHAALIDRCRVAVDLQFLTSPVVITQASEIALIPPVSGG